MSSRVVRKLLFTFRNSPTPGTGVSSSNYFGIWINTGGELLNVVRAGDLFDVDPTDGIDLRKIYGLSYSSGSGGEDGRRLSFNDDGLLTFNLSFTDGTTGIFTALIPEPASAGLLALLAPALLRRRR